MSAVAWSAPGELEYRDWLLEGRRIGVFARGSQWWVGDWLLYGTGRWGETYLAAAKVTGYDPKSLRNMRYVAARVDVSRRRDNLTFGHHDAVASLDAEGQRRWLKRASEERLSVEDLRIELRTAKQARGPELESREELGSERQAIVICPNCGDAVPIPAGVVS